MNIPPSGVFGGREGAGDPSTHGEPSLAPSSTPLPSERAAAPSTIETPESDGAGFTSVVRHLSLRGWLRWIHSNHSDAALSVRTRDGTNGRIWCADGAIIDAEWGGLPAELALQQMLLLSSGSVMIDFDRVHRLQRIISSTRELLHVTHDGEGRPTEPTEAEAALAASPAGTVRTAPFYNSLIPTPEGEQGVAHASVPRTSPEARRGSRGGFLAPLFVLAALAMAAFAFGRSRAWGELEPARAAPTAGDGSGLLPVGATEAERDRPITAPAPKAPDLPLITFAEIAVDPPHASIWLDQELVGTGRVQQGPILDGMMHELRFVAPGHETRSLFFRDMPPTGRVILERTAERDRDERESVAGPSADSAVKPMTRRRPSPAPAEARPVSKGSPSAPTSPQVQRPPEVRVIEVQRPPEVRVIEVQTPRVQVIN